MKMTRDDDDDDDNDLAQCSFTSKEGWLVSKKSILFFEFGNSKLPNI